MSITVPARHNPTLQQVVDRINANAELHQLWRCVNINAVDRSGISDHGEVHIRIVANIALRIARLLTDGGVEMGVVEHYDLSNDDAEVIVVLAACLHDLGISIHRRHHEEYSLFLAHAMLGDLLLGAYDPVQAVIITSEVLHAIAAHRSEETCLTIEAGILKVADALDMTKGRSRIPFEAGAINIHSTSAAAIEQVEIMRGQARPVLIEITMNNSSGVFQLDELLKPKLQNSSIASYVEIVARIEAESEKRLIEVYAIGSPDQKSMGRWETDG